MRKILFIIVFLITGPLHADQALLQKLENKPTPEFKPPKIQTHTFDNGLRLYYLENDELPTFELSALVEAGTVHEPAEKLGITSMMMSGIRTGGSGKQSGDDIDAELDRLAASMGVDTDKEYSLIKIASLVKDMDRSLGIFFDLLRSPKFEEAKLEITRQRMLDALDRRNEQPMEVSRREFRQQLFGDGSVWARIPLDDTVKNVTRQDIIDYYNRTVVPERFWVAVAAQMPFKEFVKKMDKAMEGWKPLGTDKPGLTAVKRDWKGGIYFVEKPGNQSSIVMGHFGEKRFNPDKYAIVLANFVLGGSTFGSRLGNQIRTNLGLAYSVSTNFGFGSDYDDFQILVGTKSESTVQVLEESQRILKEMIETKPVTEAELEFAKKTILNQLIFQYEDPFSIVEARRFYDFFGYPPDYMELYQKEIKKVTLAQVQEALKKYFHPDQLLTMIVGDGSLVKSLEKLGPVEKIPAEKL